MIKLHFTNSFYTETRKFLKVSPVRVISAVIVALYDLKTRNLPINYFIIYLLDIIQKQ